MVTEDQHEVVAFLLRPATHGPACAAVEHLETHSAMVFLAGDRALKLKRAVRYDYLDFSTAERRRQCCEAEVAINRRVAPSLYRGVVAVTREADGQLALAGGGPPVDWLVDMTRFDDAALADRLADAGRLPVTAMASLAAAVVAFHAGAPARPDKGGAAGLRWATDGNQRAFIELHAMFPAGAGARLGDATARVLESAAGRLESRRQRGLVRQCHGDLHLGNIVCLDGVPTPFDAVEFNDDISCIDVAYDLAFLLMDLWHRGLPAHANAVLNEYLRDTGDLDCLALLPLFLSCRAAVRAKTSATAATLADDAPARETLVAAAHRYVAAAETFLAPPPPHLVIVAGLSGSGKSTTAARVAPAVGAAPGAVHLRTDVIRKALFAVAPLTRLPADAYAPEVSARVYARLAHDAAAALAAGHAVVCDGVFSAARERDALADVARSAAVPFTPVWLDAPAATLLARVGGRHGDASDATEDVVRQQLAGAHPPSGWVRVDAAGSPDDTAALVLAAVTAPAPRHL